MTTRRLKPSFSARPFHTAVNASVNLGPSACGLTVPPSRRCISKSCSQIGRLPGTAMRYGRSLRTMKPMFSRIGSACDNGIGEAERNRRR